MSVASFRRTQSCESVQIDQCLAESSSVFERRNVQNIRGKYRPEQLGILLGTNAWNQRYVWRETKVHQHHHHQSCVKWNSRVGSSWKRRWAVRWSNTPPSWSRTPYRQASARPAQRPRSISHSTRSLPRNTYSEWVCRWQGGLEEESGWWRQWPWCDCSWVTWSQVEIGERCWVPDRRQAEDGVWGLRRRPCTSGSSCSWRAGSGCRCRGSSSPTHLSLSEEGFTWRSAHALPWATASWWQRNNNRGNIQAKKTGTDKRKHDRKKAKKNVLIRKRNWK